MRLSIVSTAYRTQKVALGFVSACAIAGLNLAMPMSATAQPALVADGNAAVTGFSGAVPPVMIAPGVDPATKMVIDVNGAVLRVLDLQTPGSPPNAQVITVQKPFTTSAGQLGQVFAVALDNARPPNIYVATSSVYGLPIVAPVAGGATDRLDQGAPNARFMDGLFGPADQQGGPGSIWRIDGASGAVRLFANVMLDNVPNSGAALGGLAFDPASNSLFVADRETGFIHRFDMTGVERGRYDHGAQGRQTAGLPPVPFDPAGRANITSPSFRPADPQTWGYAAPQRRVFGLAVRAGRLYYSIAEGLQVWSVALAQDGAFGADARMEFALPPSSGASEISKIAFDDQGRMVLAERIAPSGASDFDALTQTGGGRIVRLTPSGGGSPLWQPAPGDSEAGLDPSRKGNGGVAVGYGYDAAFRRNPSSCSGALWWTGEQLAQGTAVNGLEGRPEGAQLGWLIDFDDRLDDPQSRGRMGDIAIYRPCAPDTQVAGGPPPGQPGGPPPEETPPEGYPPAPQEVASVPPPEGDWPGPWGPWPVGPWPDGGPPPPPPVCPLGTHLEQGGATNGPRQCCPVVGGVTTTPGFNGQCQSHCANAPPGPPVPKDNLTCELGFQAGHGPTGAGPIWGPLDGGGPGALICWNGQAPASFGFGGSHWAKKCPKPPLAQCQAGFQLQYASPGNPATAAWEWSNARCVPTPAQAGCPPGQQVGANGACAVLCPGGQRAFPVNSCCMNGTAPNPQGQCNPGIFVPPQWYLDYLATGTGECVVPPGNPPACSFYEFTITARQRFGRGSLTQRITLPARSALEARITRGSKYCPASAWSCSKNGDVLTCSADQCGLEPGDQVVLRLDGKVAPDLTEAPPRPIEKTACAVLEWQAMAGPGTAVIEQIRDLGRVMPPPSRPGDGPGTDQYGRVSSKQACWTIRIRGERPPPPPACATNSVAMPDGQCCLASQATQSGQCCAPGLRPDSQRRACVPVTPPVIVQPPVGCPAGSVALRGGGCCPRDQLTASRQCCSPGTRPDARRRACVPVTPPPDVVVVPPVVERPCPSGTYRMGARCVPEIQRPCPAGMHRIGRRCVPDVVTRPCPAGMHRIGRRCVPDVVTRPCPAGMHRVGMRCVPNPSLQRPRPPRPSFNRPRPSRGQAVRQRRPVRPVRR